MRRPVIWYVRDSDRTPRNGGERVLGRPRCIEGAWDTPDFTILTPARMKRLGARARADIAIICGARAANLLRRVVDVKRRAVIRVFIPAWHRSRRHLRREVKEAHRGDYRLIIPDQRMFLGDYRQVHKRVHFVDRGFDPDTFSPLPEGERTRQIVFCGEYEAYGRLDRLRVMATHFPGRVEWVRGLSHPRMAEFLRSGTIGWNQILRGPPAHSIGINYRVWEDLGSGLLLLCSRSEDVDLVLEDDKHYVSWGSEAELLDKARYHMDNDKEREEIARCGHQEALSKHTWAHRGRQYRELIEAHS